MNSLYNFWFWIQPSPEVIGAIVAALLGAFAASMLSYWLTQRLEQQKYNRERYQKLYAPKVSEIYSYLTVNSIPPGNEDYIVQKEDPEELRKDIINHIAENVMYGAPALLSAYHDLRSINTVVGYKEDEDPTKKTVKLFTVLLEELSELNILEGNALAALTEYLTLYRIWSRLMEVSFKPEVYRGTLFLHYRGTYDPKKLNFATYRKIDRRINNEIKAEIKNRILEQSWRERFIRWKARNTIRKDTRLHSDRFANVIVCIVKSLARPNDVKSISDRIIEESREISRLIEA